MLFFLPTQKKIIWWSNVKFIYSEKATKFCEICTVDLCYVVPVKSRMEILQNFVAFPEYMNFKYFAPKFANLVCGVIYEWPPKRIDDSQKWINLSILAVDVLSSLDSTRLETKKTQ